MEEGDQVAEAEQNALQATFILHELQANVQVYGSNSMLTGAIPADVDLALRFINRALENFPDSPNYLNIKALLLIDGGIDKAAGIKLLERAHEIDPRDIMIQNNLEKTKASACFVATAIYGSDTCWEVTTLRRWRDDSLSRSKLGTSLVKLYYHFGPKAARFLLSQPRLGLVIRRYAMAPLVRFLNTHHR